MQINLLDIPHMPPAGSKEYNFFPADYSYDPVSLAYCQVPDYSF